MELQELKQNMEEYLAARKVEMQRAAKQYSLQGDKKAAELEMEKLSVYDIFTTTLNTCMLKVTMNKTVKPEDRMRKFCEDYLLQFITLPKEWRLQYSMAVEKKMEDKMILYEVKLGTSHEIRDEFLRQRDKEKNNVH